MSQRRNWVDKTIECNTNCILRSFSKNNFTTSCLKVETVSSLLERFINMNVCIAAQQDKDMYEHLVPTSGHLNLVEASGKGH